MQNNSRNAIYIASIDAKDLYISNNYIDQSKNGYVLRKRNGEFNMRKFRNSLDYSLDLIKLRDVFQKTYHEIANNDAPFSFMDRGKEYSQHVINVTFHYSVKEFNMITHDLYVRLGYRIQDCDFGDTPVAYNEAGQLIGIKTNMDTVPQYDIPSYFVYIQAEDEPIGHYEASGGIPVVMSRRDVREWIYKNGFCCEGIHYVRFKRSSGSARVGKCLFINDKLYSRMHTYEKCGLTVRDGQKIDLAAWESYISLTSSSIIDTIEIDPNSILVIDDYDSKFVDTVMATKVVDGHLFTEPETIEVKNSIWDGQSLIDISAMGEYAEHGMILVRNRFFKSCCFNTNIQKWFQDNNITEISQLHGRTRAQRVEDIKIITTPSSIKFLKFGDLDMWLDKLETTFGVVKYEKKTHYFDGDMVRTHYQLLNTLQMSFEETKELLKDSIEYILAMRDDPAVLRNYLKFTSYRDDLVVGAQDKNEVIYALMNLNDQFPKTKMYAEFVSRLIKSQTDLLKCGRVLVNGNYSTLFGNPVEMLLFTIGKFDGKSQLGEGCIHSTRFAYNRKILMSRSPHVTIGNLMVENNVENKELDTYFNLTNEICCMNSINENSLARLSGSDYDSDTALLTDNDLLINVALRNYDKFLVPTSLVSADKMNRFFTDEQKADLDFVTSVNKIGEIINFSQILNSLFWDNVAHGQSFEENMQLYADISQLDVMSNLEIDKAKKIFEVDNAEELRILKAKYQLNDESGLQIQPKFFMHVARKKGYYIKGKKNYKNHMTTMDYIQTIVDRSMVLSRKYNQLSRYPISYVLDKDKYDSKQVNYQQIDKIVEIAMNARAQCIAVYSVESYTADERRLLEDRINYDAMIEYSKVRMNYSTAYRLVFELDTNPDYKKLKTPLFYTLLSLPLNDFFRVFTESHNNIITVRRNTNAYDCTFYGIPFKHFKINTDGSYEDFDYKSEENEEKTKDIFTKCRQI